MQSQPRMLEDIVIDRDLDGADAIELRPIPQAR